MNRKYQDYLYRLTGKYWCEARQYPSTLTSTSGLNSNDSIGSILTSNKIPYKIEFGMIYVEVSDIISIIRDDKINKIIND